MNDNNSDDPAPFVRLAAITANVTRFLTTAHHDPGKDHGDGEAERQKDSDKGQGDALSRALIDRRLADLAEFERRASGNGPRRQRK